MPDRVLGADLGGTSIKWGIVDREGNAVKEGRAPLPDRKPETVAGLLKEIVREAIAETGGNLAGIGIGSPGLIDRDGQIVRVSPNFPDWKDVPLADFVREAAGDIPVLLENDANLLVYSETRWGAAVGLTDIICLTLGTGVGGGVMTGGVVLRGIGGGAAELGHVPLTPDGPLCGCGNHGCLEAYCNIDATMRTAEEVYSPDAPPKDPAALSEAAEAGDERAREVWRRIGGWLGLAVGGFVNIFNPQAVLVGGGISGAGEWILAPARKVAAERAYAPNWEQTELKLAGLRHRSGLLGAAALAFSAADNRQ